MARNRDARWGKARATANIRTSLLLACLAPFASSCATIDGTSEPRDAIYVGVVRVVVPATQGKLHVVETKALGLGWDQGAFLGWRDHSWIVADPRDCQLVIVIRSPAQAENARKVIQSLEGQDACIADFTRK